MTRSIKYICLVLITAVIAGSCKKDEEPEPEDLFIGEYFLEEVIEEYDPEDPDLEEEKFLAPEEFNVGKSDFLNPVTGEMVTSYKFFIGDTFLGLSEQPDSGGTVIVGTQSCPNNDELSGVSITIQESGAYRLNMLSCIGREVLADYNRILSEE